MRYRIDDIHQKREWDRYVESASPWSLFQSWDWGEVVHTLNQPVYRIGVYADEKLMGAAQVIEVRARRGKFLHIRHGPVIGSKSPPQEIWKVLINHVTALGRKQRCFFIRVSPLIDDSPANRLLVTQLGFIPSPIQSLDAEVCWVLDLDQSPDQLLSRMRKSTRYLIRQAEKIGVTVAESRDIDTFLKLYEVTTRRHRIVPHRAIAEEFEIFAKSKRAMLLLGSYQGQILGGALVLMYGNHAIYHHGASERTKIPVSYLIQWRAIQTAQKLGLKLYNFWGITANKNQDHPWYGLTLFKQGFGGRAVRFMHAHDLPLTPFYRLPHALERIRKIMRGYD